MEYESDGDTYFKELSLQNYLEKMTKHTVDIIEKLKSTGSSWKMYLAVGLFFEYVKNDKKAKREMFINSVQGAITLETDSGVFVDNIVESIKNKYEDLEN